MFKHCFQTIYVTKKDFQLTTDSKGRTIAHAVSRWLPTMAAQV
jgi:hypothetical protein